MFPPIDRDLSVDVAVIGGGIAGLTTAYLLKRSGRSVALLERGRCGGADTGHTSAHLTCVTDLRLAELRSAFGDDHAQAAWDAGLAAIYRIEETVSGEGLDCHFERVPGYLHLPRGTEVLASEIQQLQREARIAREMGFSATYVADVPFVRRPGICYDGQARFHPRLYLAGLARAVDGGGSYIFEHSPADEVQDEPLAVVSGSRTVRCGFVVVATHNPIVGRASWLGASWLQTKLALYTSYVVGGLVPAGLVPDALFWDTADPYQFIRIDPRGPTDFVLLGGADHKTGQADEPLAQFDQLERALRELAPDIDVTHRWSGQVVESTDGLPLIGEMARNQFAFTGCSGNGLTFGTLGAMMATDAVLNRRNPWSELFDLNRTKIKGGLWDYISENKDYPYYMLRDRLRRPEARSLDDVPRGEGRVVQLDGRKVAAYRADDGSLSVRSAVCTHLGCLVRWNAAGNSWDCACHGSRFSTSGDVIGGPAETPLSAVEVESGRPR